MNKGFSTALFRRVLRKTEVNIESKDKTRVSLLLDRDLVETADKIMKERGYRSRNQFYLALLADAVADEVTDKHKDILGEKFAKAMTEYVEEMKRAISKGLFRYAVHQEIMSRMMAEHYGYTYTHVTTDMQKRASGIVGGFMEDLIIKE